MLNAKDIATDWVKVGTMLVVSKWLSGGSLMDVTWQKGSLATILGFTAYHLSTRNFMTPKNAEGPAKLVADDILKVGTMFIVSQMITGGSLADSKWLSGAIATIIGFIVYDILTINYLKGKNLTYNTKLQSLIDDWAKVGTMLLVSRLISCESLLDPKWMMASIGTLLGFSVYDVGTSHIIDKLF
jgi:hypothetical protein